MKNTVAGDYTEEAPGKTGPMHAEDRNMAVNTWEHRSRGESEKNGCHNPNNYEDRHCRKETKYFHVEMFLTPS